jgi:LacI family transcriptional regulator
MIDAPHPQQRRATIRDVSALAGVSIKTVSRVLNNENYVSAATRERIEEAMASLNFHPSTAARALAGHRTHQVALICDNPNPWYVYEVQYGTRQRCHEDKVRMIAQPYDRNAPDLLDEVGSLIDQVHLDGLILTPPASDHAALLADLQRRQMPFVRIQPGTELEISPSAYVDNEAAAHDMTRYLLSLGHRRIGFIVGDRGYAVSDQRLRGHAHALAQAGLELDPDLVRQGRFDFASGATAADDLLALPERPTAIFAASDDMAAGALATAHRRGVRVPDELSVAGFDDTSFAPILWPALTTIRQPVRALAEAAADMLLAPGKGARRRQIAHELVIRDSVAPPPTV